MLQNTRGGRGRGTSVALRPESWRMPPLPREVTETLDDALQRKHFPGALSHTRKVWRAWWESTPSMAVDLGSDMEALSFWIVCVFRRSLYGQIVRTQPIVVGSHQQPMTNPLERTIDRLSEHVARAEAKFGMTTLDRFRLHFEVKASPEDDEAEMAAAAEDYRRLLEG